ncbi:GlxA family transcriptional regulator [Rhizobium sp. KVB221]|uniref:GlxA family transcriptional regulator n=1 Tax=Rhizobium setariae TaxID=2801340 RepID=A0A936YVW4_9HYPH|nr:GlxA family transcriptional regulator [Rhizobium setariae]MBL0374941.1 GlxA family transcriptional regulator [Rhizobium setariae]
MGSEPYRIGFILVPGFALMSFASAVEPLRAANLLAGRSLYDVRFFSSHSGRVSASTGAHVDAEPLPRKPDGLDALFVVAGGDPAAENPDPALFSCLRRMARWGVTIGGISGGPFLLAAAGLLADRRFTVHWEHASALMERWPDLHPERVRFVIDRDRITCGGGVAPLDLMHAIIESRQGSEFARSVSDWYLHTHVDAPASPQRSSIVERYRVHHKVLAAVLEKMEHAIEKPLSRADMAEFAGISERHLDRLFATVMQSGFQKEYLKMRLERARTLLRQSPMKISEIALACGFSGSSQFARAWRAMYGESPGSVRKS